MSKYFLRPKKLGIEEISRWLSRGYEEFLSAHSLVEGSKRKVHMKG
jgi:hypothetical protein